MKKTKIFQLTLASALILSVYTPTSSAFTKEIANPSPHSMIDHVVENQYLLSADPSFDGIFDQEFRDLGVISLEEIFNDGDFMIYLATTTENAENIIENLENLNLFLSVEENYQGELMEEMPVIPDCDFGDLQAEHWDQWENWEENEAHQEITQENLPESEKIPEISDAFDPEGEAMPEGAFASPQMESPTLRQWLAGIMGNLFGFFFP